MKNNLLLFLLFVLSINISFAQIGINISLKERGGTYIDVVKENYRWNNLQGTGITSDEVDAQGWPSVDALYIVDYRPVAEWIGVIDDPEVYRIDPSGTYKCSFIGKATLSSLEDGAIENMIYDSGTNTSTFDFVVPTGSVGLFLIEFLDTERDASSGINTGFINFKMIRPGYENGDNLFHQPFLDILNEINFSAARYMIFTGTNGRDPAFPNKTTWAERKLPTDASQNRISTINKNGRACWEHVIQLSNMTMTDPWINIPVSADSNYVIELAKMFQSDLDPSLNIYVESSNEVWNTAPGFEQTLYNKSQATSLGIDERNNHARRTRELSHLFAVVYGQEEINNKIRVILASHQPMLEWWLQPMLVYLNSNFGAPSEYIYGIAGQTYFTAGAAPEGVDDLLVRCHKSIEDQITELSNNKAGRTQWIQKANDWNFIGGYFSYEGGPDHGGGSITNIDNRILLERSEGMCDMIKYNYDTAFLQLGGNLAMHFNLSTAYTRYGSFGLTDDINHPYRNHKMQCVKDIIDQIISIKPTELNNKNGFDLYPNPSDGHFKISFELSKKENIQLTILNSIGETMNTIVNEEFLAGKHNQDCLSNHLPEGIYFVQLQIGEKIMGIKKMVIVK